MLILESLEACLLRAEDAYKNASPVRRWVDQYLGGFVKNEEDGVNWVRLESAEYDWQKKE